MKKGRFNVVMGGQAGSEGKGKLSAYLAWKWRPEVIACSMSPNAGHTAYSPGGEKFVTYHLPAGIVGHPKATVVLGPSTVIRIPTLVEEYKRLSVGLGNAVELVIDARAVIVEDRDIEDERSMTVIGSTAQGVGRARARKLMRVNVTRAADVHRELPGHVMEDTSLWLYGYLRAGRTVLYEMSQGFDLCLEHGIDPVYCTSRIVSPQMALAEMGIAVEYLGHVYGVIRPYPIRVNNRDGSSGPYAEAREITWGEVTQRSGSAVPIAELTTTTKLPRRVFEFSWDRFSAFCRICAPSFMCLQFADYLDARARGERTWQWLPPRVKDFAASLRGCSNCTCGYIGTGPLHEEMVDVGADGVKVWK